MKAAPRRAAAAPQPAYVLHRWDWSETSLVLDLFTREAGRVAVVAKGAKRPYSQLRSVLLPFQRISVLLGRPPSEEGTEVQTLRSAEWAGGPTPPRGAALFAGFYLNELLMKLLARQDPHPRLFDDYAAALSALAASAGDGEAEQEAVLRAFELRLLQAHGVLPELDRATPTQQPLQPARRYALQAEAGLVGTADDAAPSGLQWLAIGAALELAPGAAREVVPGAAVSAAADAALRRACAAALPALKLQLRPLLHYHLGSSTLRTRQVMLEAQRLLEPPAAPSR